MKQKSSQSQIRKKIDDWGQFQKELAKVHKKLDDTWEVLEAIEKNLGENTENLSNISFLLADLIRDLLGDKVHEC